MRMICVVSWLMYASSSGYYLCTFYHNIDLTVFIVPLVIRNHSHHYVYSGRDCSKLSFIIINHFFTSTTVIANHKTPYSSASSNRQPPGLPLKIKISSLQTRLSWPIWSFTLSIWTTPTLTATLSPPGPLEIGPELLLTTLLENPLWFVAALVNISWRPGALGF